MTDEQQDRDDESPAVAALAIQVSRLRQELDTLAGAQQRHGAALRDVTDLKQQVERILAILDAERDASPAAWFWLTMSDEERETKFGELHDWVETVLRQQYPDYLADHIKPCWQNHPEARWELTWLYQLWSLTYLTDRSAPKDAADWHDRWCLGVIRRLSQIMTRCTQASHAPP
ncbi:MAG TPA: hypothetical protein VNF47_00585 [Streptosporangiaceae bacterium]|nr:hypothetical protein [Streptosporangiaceae bacterium]